MEFKWIIGIDVSKEELDFAAYQQGKLVFHLATENNAEGIKSFLKSLGSHGVFSNNELLFCMEHTGIYCNHLLDYLTKKSICIWLEHALTIKAFFGLVRGKNDKLDAIRIGEYAYVKRDKAKIWEPPRQIIKQLKYLSKIRDRLIKTKIQLNTPLKEADGFVDKQLTKQEKKVIEPILKKIQAQLTAIEQQIKKVVKSDAELNRLFNVVTSVTGVGEVIGIQIIVVTNEFKDIKEAKKMACHCGVVPFSHQSGKSVRGKPRVSHRAHKGMKKLLHLGAMAAIGVPGELKDYYERKVAQGKNRMAVLNAVRNKIIHRIFACVDKNKKYEKTYEHSLA